MPVDIDAAQRGVKMSVSAVSQDLKVDPDILRQQKAI